MTTKANLMEAHEAMARVLDAKFPNSPEWKAFRSIDRALLDLGPEGTGRVNGGSHQHVRKRREHNGQHPSYMSLADRALTESGKPISTTDLVDYIAQRRPLSGNDPAKARIVIQSSLSKDKRFKSVPWGDKRAWWYADRAVPK